MQNINPLIENTVTIPVTIPRDLPELYFVLKFWGFAFTIKDVTLAALNEKTEREHTRNSFGLLPQGYCERKIPKS